MTKHCVGFAFDAQGKHIVLIRKNRPAWQRGLLNGVGGHIEENESPHAAQAREFKEETGIESYASNWKEFALLTGTGYELHCFSLFSNEIYYLADKTDEKLGVYSINELSSLSTIPNLQWLIPAAWDQHFNYSELFLRGNA